MPVQPKVVAIKPAHSSGKVMLLRQQRGIPINQCQGQQDGTKAAPHQGGGSRPPMGGIPGKQQCGGDFHQRVAHTMRCWHWLQRPRNTSQLSTGIFSNQRMPCPHWGQREGGCERVSAGAGGVKSSCPACAAMCSAHSASHCASMILGKRWMTTFKKLPTNKPKKPKTIIAPVVPNEAKNSIKPPGRV